VRDSDDRDLAVAEREGCMTAQIAVDTLRQWLDEDHADTPAGDATDLEAGANRCAVA
jgi:hypothetical protein